MNTSNVGRMISRVLYRWDVEAIVEVGGGCEESAWDAEDPELSKTYQSSARQRNKLWICDGGISKITMNSNALGGTLNKVLHCDDKGKNV